MGDRNGCEPVWPQSLGLSDHMIFRMHPAKYPCYFVESTIGASPSHHPDIQASRLRFFTFYIFKLFNIIIYIFHLLISTLRFGVLGGQHLQQLISLPFGTPEMDGLVFLLKESSPRRPENRTELGTSGISLENLWGILDLSPETKDISEISIRFRLASSHGLPKKWPAGSNTTIWALSENSFCFFFPTIDGNFDGEDDHHDDQPSTFGDTLYFSRQIAGWWFPTFLFSISYMGCHPSH